MEKRNSLRRNFSALWVCFAIFVLYVLLVLVDGGLSLMLGWRMSSALAIGLCILLWGVPLLSAAVCARLGKTRPAIALVILGGVFTVIRGSQLGSMLYMPYIGLHLLMCCAAACIAVVALLCKRGGSPTKAPAKMLLWLGILSIVVSMVFSMHTYRANKGMLWIGFHVWSRVFASKGLLASLPASFGVAGLTTGRSCAALWPMSGSVSILLLWRMVAMAPVEERQGSNRYPELAAYRAQHPGINREPAAMGSYACLEVYKRNL